MVWYGGDAQYAPHGWVWLQVAIHGVLSVATSQSVVHVLNLFIRPLVTGTGSGIVAVPDSQRRAFQGRCP